MWRLNYECATSWKHLEDTLVLISRTLLAEVGLPLPLHFKYFPLPSTKGYLQTHGTSDTAMQCMAKSRDTFVPLLALCSMAISFVIRKDRDATDTSWPLWMKVLKETHGIHEAWLENLRQSPIAQFGLGLHLGVIINVSSCQWLNFVPALLNSHVPIWFYWGNTNPDHTRPSLSHANRPSIDQYCPTVHEILSAAAAHDLPPTSPTHYDQTPYPQEPPKPEVGSQQRQGETWQEFFTRQDIRHAEMVQRKSEIDRQRRKSREDAAAAKPYPGRHGPTVFMWTDDEEEDGSTEQSINKEKVTYLTSPRLPKRTNLLNFWVVSFYFSGACYDNLCIARSICTTTRHGSRLPWTTYPFKRPQCPANGYFHQVLRLTTGATIESSPN